MVVTTHQGVLRTGVGRWEFSGSAIKPDEFFGTFSMLPGLQGKMPPRLVSPHPCQIRVGFFFCQSLILDIMKKYITADKIGQFCQVIWNKGLTVSVDKEEVAVKLPDGHYEFIPILAETSFVDLCNSFEDTNKNKEC